jgi:hypothetical protein
LFANDDIARRNDAKGIFDRKDRRENRSGVH